jgi:DNA invertase Pin-like site-specific DNA recombinase
MASVAEFEGGRISERTREALSAARAGGVMPGGTRPGTFAENTAAKATAEAEKLRAVLAPMAAAGLNLLAMAAALTGAGAGTVTRSGALLGLS